METQAKERPFHSKVCSNSYSRMHSLKVHMYKHNYGKFGKLECCSSKMRLMRKASSELHLITQARVKPFQCAICCKPFNNLAYLDGHIRLLHKHEQLHNCTICRKGFVIKRDLDRHLMVHTGEKPFNCVFCGKNVRQLETLFSHIRSHVKEKPFWCRICESSLSYLCNPQQSRKRGASCKLPNIPQNKHGGNQ